MKIMGLISKVFGAVSKEEMNGAHIDLNQPFWEIEGKTNFPRLLSALTKIFPKDSILYFEGGSPNKQLSEFFNRHAIQEQLHVAFGTIWPRPKVFHVPASQQIISKLVSIAETCADPEIAVHFHVYHDAEVLLEWHDAFTQPMFLSGNIAEEKVKNFVDTLSMKSIKCKSGVEQNAREDRGY